MAKSSRRRGRWQSGHEPRQRGRNTRRRLAVDAQGMPVGAVMPSGTRADCQAAGGLMAGLSADCLLADKGQDTHAIVN